MGGWGLVLLCWVGVKWPDCYFGGFLLFVLLGFCGFGLGYRLFALLVCLISVIRVAGFLFKLVVVVWFIWWLVWVWIVACLLVCCGSLFVLVLADFVGCLVGW